MKTLIKDYRDGMGEMRASYLRLLLPVALLMSALSYGYVQTNVSTMITPLLALYLYLFIIVPGFIISPQLEDFKAKLRSFDRASQVALPISLSAFLIPMLHVETYLETLVVSVGLAAVFVAIMAGITHCTMAASNAKHPKPWKTIIKIWYDAPAYLFRLLVGLTLPIGAAFVFYLLQRLTQNTNTEVQSAIALLITTGLIFPACFFPFVMTAKKLNRDYIACVEKDLPSAETQTAKDDSAER